MPTAREASPSRATATGVALAIPLVLFHLAAHRGFMADDAFITFRYAQNLASGEGWVFNPGGSPAEGTTSYLWTLLCAPAFWVGWDPLAWGRVFSIVSWLGVLALAARMAGALAGSRGALLAPPVLAAIPWSGLHLLSGMETVLFTLLVTWCAFLGMRMIASPSPPGWMAWVLAAGLLAMGLTRPEGNLVGLVIALVLLLSDGRGWRGLAIPLALVWVIPGALFFVTRWMYFGNLLPLPYYVKVGEAGMFAGLTNVARFAAFTGVVLGGGWILLRDAWRWPAVWLVAAIPASMAMFYTMPEPVMGFGQRFLFPVLPLMVVLSVAGWARWVGRTSRAHVATLATGLIILVLLATTGRSSGWAKRYSDGLMAAHRPLAQDLVAMQQRGRPAAEHRLVIGDVGLVPFLSGWHTHDVIGLNDPAVARREPRTAADFLNPPPDAIVLISRSAEEFVPVIELEGAIHDALSPDDWGHARSYAFSPSYHLWLFLPRSSGDQSR